MKKEIDSTEKSQQTEQEDFTQHNEVDHSRDNDSDAWGPKQQAEYDQYLAKQRKKKDSHISSKSVSENTKQKLLVERTNPDKTIDALADIIVKTGEFYDHDGNIVEVICDRKTASPKIHDVNASRIVLEAHQRARPYIIKFNNGKFEEKDTLFPKEFATMYLSGNYHQTLLPLRAIISSPLLGLDGSINCVNGYHKETGFYLTGLPDVESMVCLLYTSPSPRD